ncbi:MAG: transporter substrate-binding domain-containing protein [Selenomonadaceae bacterium]|nr:transporter substrate-binding domain-containing protein [Selenomonadaceae bacterium]
MKLKRFAKILLSCVLAGALFTGCGTGGQQGVDKPSNNFSGDEVKLGMLTHLNSTETKMGELYNSLAEKPNMSMHKTQPKFYDNLRTMQLAIEAGDVQEISLYKCVADYLVASNNKFEIVSDDFAKLTDVFCFAVRKEDTALKAELDKVIDEMKTDGTLDKLIETYITKVDKGKVPPKIQIPPTEGAPTIKVGVTGDLPPLDFVNPDGTAAGFNTALLAEVAKRLGKNIELVQIESGSRAAALTSEFIDVVFWAVVPFGNSDIPVDIDKPDGLDLSTPYFKDSVAHIKLKSDK